MDDIGRFGGGWTDPRGFDTTIADVMPGKNMPQAWAWRTRKKASKLGKYVPGPSVGGGSGHQWDTDPGFGESIKGGAR